MKRLVVILSLLLPLAVSAQSVEFRVGSAKLDPFYRDNLTQLDAIYEAILQSDGAEHLSLYGWTSPEGDGKMNLSLAQRRAEALKEFLLNIFPELSIEIKAGGEDWIMLERLVEKSNLRNRKQILVLLRSAKPADRERALGRYSTQLQTLYPKLRRVETYW